MSIIGEKSWHNNRISKKLNEDYPRSFSICDIDGLVRCNYKENGAWITRFIIYESKNDNEKPMNDAQKKSLELLDFSINWKQFDKYSGLYVLKIIDINQKIIWYNIKGENKYETTFDELYNIFSCKTR